MKWAVAAALAIGVGAGTMIGACLRAQPTHSPGQLDEIDQLWMQIRDWRVEAHMTADPSRQTLMEIEGMSVHTVRKNAMCPTEPKSEECDDVCGLAEAICDNAESICDLARELPDDTWAADKCKSATASCREAKERCCACNDPDGDGRDK